MEEELLQIEDVMEYYRSSMPYCDREDVSKGVLTAYAQHALFLRERVEWCRKLPMDIFLENVAAYRINSERIEDCRRMFYDMVMPLIDGLTLKEAILQVNLWCCANATYHQADDRTANAVTVYKSGYGRCGEESTFAVTILRSVGIAARQVYAPLWSHCDDNHAWVEVWCDGRWQYFGACEPEPVLNRGWFDLPASKAMLVHARTFGAARGRQELLGRMGKVTYYNVTSHYADTAEVVFFCTDEADRPLAGNLVKLEILNYAHFGTIAALRTDEKGRLSLRLGLGSLRLSCMRDHREMSTVVRVEQSGELLVKLESQSQEIWTERYFFAPKGSIKESKKVCPEAFVSFQEKVEKAKEQREQRIGSYYDPEREKRYPQAEEILRIAGGNFEEMIRFLEIDNNPYRLKLLKVLTQKDYYDCKADVLQEHLEGALMVKDEIICHLPDALPEDIFVRYVLNPRIEYEELSYWRRPLAKELSGKAARYRENPQLIWTEICSAVCPPVEDAYDTLRMQPLSVFKSGRGSFTDQKILFVAAARSLGIPARLHPETGEPEFYKKDRFCPAIARSEDEEGGRLTFLAGEEKSWIYWTDWCLEYLHEDGYCALDLRERKWEKGRLSLAARQGLYRITTVARLANGDQVKKEYCFRMGKEDRTVTLERCNIIQDTEAKKLEPIKVCVGAERIRLDDLRGEKKAAYIWLREGEEPTEHVLNELLERISDVKNQREHIFLLSMAQPKPAGTLERLLQAVEGIGFYQVESQEAAERTAETMGAQQLKYPLAVSIDETGRGSYVTCGYHVGAVAQLLLRL